MTKSIVIKGVSEKGLGLGKKLGFPTININYDGKLTGVFAGKARLCGEEYVAAINLGGRPTVDDNSFLCEVFLLDFGGIVKEKTAVEVVLHKKIRDVKKFKDLEELRAQIARDVEFVKNCYTLGKK